MTMSSEVSELPDGSAVRVLVEMDVAGKLVQFGRGLVEEVARQLFQQFATCVRTELSAQPPATASADPDASATTPIPPQGAASVDTRLGSGAAVEKPQVNGLRLILKAVLAWGRRILRPRREPGMAAGNRLESGLPSEHRDR